MSDVIQVLSVGAPDWRDLTPGGVPAEGVPLSLWIERGELDRLLGAYAPQNASSPLVGDCRPLVREVLDAILAARQ